MSEGDTSPVLEIDDLWVDYRAEGAPVRAIDGVSLRVGRGEIFGLCGESGSGKSTLATAIPRLLPTSAAITRGRIRVDGHDITAMPVKDLRVIRGRHVAVVPQSGMNALHPQLCVERQIVLALRAHPSEKTPDTRGEVRALLAMVGLPLDVAGAFPHQLSGGMRQRAALAIALAGSPSLLIMDEALGALDLVVRHQICETLFALSRQRGFAILFISHDLLLTLALADRVGVLHAGRLVEVGAAREMRAAPQHPYTRALLASFLDPLATPAFPAADAEQNR